MTLCIRKLLLPPLKLLVDTFMVTMPSIWNEKRRRKPDEGIDGHIILIHFNIVFSILKIEIQPSVHPITVTISGRPVRRIPPALLFLFFLQKKIIASCYDHSESFLILPCFFRSTFRAFFRLFQQNYPLFFQKNALMAVLVFVKIISKRDTRPRSSIPFF